MGRWEGKLIIMFNGKFFGSWLTRGKLINEELFGIGFWGPLMTLIHGKVNL